MKQWTSLTSMKRSPPTSSVQARGQWPKPSVFVFVFFLSQKVLNGQGFAMTRAEYIASSKQSPTSCLHVVRVFSLRVRSFISTRNSRFHGIPLNATER